jgi:cell division ATPase FtsA
MTASRVSHSRMRRLLSVVSPHDRVEPARSRRIRHAHVSLLDFGADTVKAIVVRRELGGVRVLGYGFASARDCDLSGGRTAVGTLAAAADQALVEAEDRSALGDGHKIVPDDALFRVPSRFVRGQSFVVRQTRRDAATPITAREVKATWARLERLMRERLSSEDGPGDTWKPLATTRNTAAVDAHPVTDPVGLKGQVLSVSAFGAAVQPSVLRAVEAVARRLEVTLADVVAGPQSLATLVPQRDAILVDVGCQGTSLSLIRHDALAGTDWWPQGGDFFTRCLADAFRCSSERAEALKRAYVGRVLTTQDEMLVARALADPVSNWYASLVANLVRLANADVANLAVSPDHGSDMPVDSEREDTLPGRIYVTGGGSMLRDLTSALRGIESAPSLRFGRAVEIESLGHCLGTRWPNQPLLLDVPPDPLRDLLAPVVSLASAAVW